jgi:DNA-binding XRE family transcriptional regulator
MIGNEEFQRCSMQASLTDPLSAAVTALATAGSTAADPSTASDGPRGTSRPRGSEGSPAGWSQVVAARIRLGRLQKGWNQLRLAAEAGVSRSTLFHLEHGQIRDPRASTLQRIFVALDLPMIPTLPAAAAPGAGSTTPATTVGPQDGPHRDEPSMLRTGVDDPLVTASAETGDRWASRGVTAAEDTRGSPNRSHQDVPFKAMLSGSDEDRFRRGEALAFDWMTNPMVGFLQEIRPDLAAKLLPDEWSELASTVGVGGPLTADGAVRVAEQLLADRETMAKLRVLLHTHLRGTAQQVVEALYRTVQLSEAAATPLPGQDASKSGSTS